MACNIVYFERIIFIVEDDSEPILGLWFEETLAPSEGTSTNNAKETNTEASAEHTITTIVPDNREPHGVSLQFTEDRMNFVINLKIIILFLF